MVNIYTETRSVEVCVVVLVLTKSVNETEKSNFFIILTSLSRNFVYSLQTFQHFGDFVKCFLRFCYKFSMKIIFYLPVNTGKPKFVAFLVFVLYDCFIYHTNFVFPKCLETRRHLGSGRETVNSQGYSELREPIKTHENCYLLIW